MTKGAAERGGLTESTQPLGNNDDQTPIPIPLSAHVKSDERGIGIEIRPEGGENVGEVFVEIYGHELRCYVWDKNQVGNDPTIHVLDWWDATEDDDGA